jgi:hypothetical protein
MPATPALRGRRATWIGMSRDEAAEMESRINQLGELVDL